MANEHWRVSDWMSKRVSTLGPRDHLVDAFETMRGHRIRHIPVMDHGKLAGIVSEREVRQAMPLRAKGKAALPSAEYGDALMNTRLDEIMCRDPLTIEPQASIREAAEVLCNNKISALPVVDGTALKGIITSEDLLWAFLENTHDQAFEEE